MIDIIDLDYSMYYSHNSHLSASYLELRQAGSHVRG